MANQSPIVFVHGKRPNGACWNRQRRLQDNALVETPDLPGHGARRDEPFTSASAVDAVLDAVNRVCGCATLVEHSLGGYAAMALNPVADLSQYPGRVLLLNGGHDHFRLGEQRFLNVCQQGALQVVPGAGH